MHRTSISVLLLSICFAAGGTSGLHAQQNSAETAQDESLAGDVPAKSATQSLRFQFQESDWKDVIPWFAEQAGFSLQPITDWPSGTFYLKDDSEYTVMAALDQLNHALRMRNPPYTLIRNRNMLILARLEDASFPNELIETVTPEQLDQRGKYEIMHCVYDLGDLDANAMYTELKPMVSSGNKDYFAVFPAANQIHVRENGGQLRAINELIVIAKNRKISGNLELKVYRLKEVDAETFMIVARGLLGMDPGKDFTPDESLRISREPFGDRLFLRGTKKMLDRFFETAAVVDVPAEQMEGIEVEKMTFKTYAIFADPKLGFNLLQTVLEGSPARMEQDEVTHSITVLGRAEDHELVATALKAIDGEGGEAFEIIIVENGLASDIMLAVQSLLRQTTSSLSETPKASGPVVMANSALNQILVRGTPQEVSEVKRMVMQLDANAIPTQVGPRTGTRIINVDEKEMGTLTPMMEDLLYATGRKNRLNIIMPDQRKDIKNRLRGMEEQPSEDDLLRDAILNNKGDAPTELRPARSNRNSESSSPRPNTDGSSRSLNRQVQTGIAIAASWMGVSPALMSPALSTVMFVAPTAIAQEENSTAGETSDETSKKDSLSYQAPQQQPSIPGSPIEIRFTEYGIVLRSDDLDALDDMERMIQLQLGEESAEQLPTFFFLQHRKAANMKTFLEQYFGISSGSGASEGGGGMMGGLMDNMLGGGTGDLLGGLLGGLDSGGTGGAGSFEGSVRMGVDVPFNAIYVAGATGNDLDQIAELIEVLDQPEAPHSPNLVGEFRTIPIIHRDPTVIKDLVITQLSGLIDTGKSGGDNQQNNEAAQMMKMMKELAGGNKGGGGAETEQEKPMVRLDVDPETSRLLVTGPEFIYNQILVIVHELDREELSTPPTMTMFQRPGNTTEIKNILKQMFGDKVEIVDGSASSDATKDSGSGSSTDKTAATNKDANDAAQKQQEQARAAMIDAMRQQAQRGGGGGGRTGGGGGAPGGGGGGRGGGGAGGGGRGGR